jgi:hypothetical protein
MKHPVLCLHQPYAGLLVNGIKTIETRLNYRCNTLIGRHVAIHATKLPPIIIPSYYCSEYIQKSEPCNIHGAIIGFVFFSGWRICEEKDQWKALIECETRRVGYFLGLPQLLKKPIVIPGKQCIPWYYDFNEEQLKGIDFRKPYELL